MELFERLKQERERLGLTQPQMAEMLGVGKTTIIRWEQGASAPDAIQLQTFSNEGADVLYILTGQRSRPIAPTVDLEPELKTLIDDYQHSDAEGKKIIRGVALQAAQAKKTKRRA
ncbi:helix-turn-helix transcriptional regulator [Herbaspirillum sp.]|uniref:helix-turn-helix domain-containing protein n=1 Tax=Herbaspirillum sp. TaxID=1890675 RepID=UPI001B2C40DC|nr:helix-turn-helix transcriptional regulator [Herbaspirillum sp.]MBO9538745.1 helix-turn-helix transcriptional regulator [Herbaspirillum sp.]